MLYALLSSKMKTVIFLAIAIILKVSKNCEANVWYTRCDLHWTPKTPPEQLCSNQILDDQIIAFNPFSCLVLICNNGMPSKAKATPCWPSKQRGCYMNGKKFYEMNVLNADGIKLYKTPKRICVNRMTRLPQMGKPSPFGMEGWGRWWGVR